MTQPHDPSSPQFAAGRGRAFRRSADPPGEGGRIGLATRVLVWNGHGKDFSVYEKLGTLGYDVVADAASAEQALSSIASLRPDAVLVMMDSLDLSSALLTIRFIRERCSCAVIVLAGQGDASKLGQLKAVKPHAIVPWPVEAQVLDVWSRRP